MRKSVSSNEGGEQQAMKQLGLSDRGFAKRPKTTRKEQFLAEMEVVMPWTRLCERIEPHYPKG